ncbi:hypothetical protein [Actinoplanes sp. NPDC049681]|uniref:hypothetical protein n=1 Tax=Actinoplanes sp. NPDC049681 TaxID=3363905 RepID=UPI0037B25176
MNVTITSAGASAIRLVWRQGHRGGQRPGSAPLPRRLHGEALTFQPASSDAEAGELVTAHGAGQGGHVLQHLVGR